MFVIRVPDGTILRLSSLAPTGMERRAALVITFLSPIYNYLYLYYSADSVLGIV